MRLLEFGCVFKCFLMMSGDMVEIMVALVKKVAFRARRPDPKGSVLLRCYYIFTKLPTTFLLRFYYPEMWRPLAAGRGPTCHMTCARPHPRTPAFCVWRCRAVYLRARELDSELCVRTVFRGLCDFERTRARRKTWAGIKRHFLGHGTGCIKGFLNVWSLESLFSQKSQK